MRTEKDCLRLDILMLKGVVCELIKKYVKDNELDETMDCEGKVECVLVPQFKMPNGETFVSPVNGKMREIVDGIHLTKRIDKTGDERNCLIIGNNKMVDIDW